MTSHANINLHIWKGTFSLVLEHCWYKIVAIFEAVYDEWVSDKDFEQPDRDSFTAEKMYYMAMEKRRYRRKSYDVRRYEDVDEYVIICI